MAALDVMRRDLEAAQRGDWDTGFGFFADDSVLHVPAGRHWPAGTAAARPSAVPARRLAHSHGATVEVELVADPPAG
jgi:hypothetical protein